MPRAFRNERPRRETSTSEMWRGRSSGAPCICITGKRNRSFSPKNRRATTPFSTRARRTKQLPSRSSGSWVNLESSCLPTRPTRSKQWHRFRNDDSRHHSQRRDRGGFAPPSLRTECGAHDGVDSRSVNPCSAPLQGVNATRPSTRCSARCPSVMRRPGLHIGSTASRLTRGPAATRPTGSAKLPTRSS
jgi:hypothetical protein